MSHDVSAHARCKRVVDDRFLRIWSWDNPEHTLKLEVQVLGGAIIDLDWDADSKRLCVVGDGKGVVSKCIMWDTGNTVGEMVGHSKKAITCAYRQVRPFRIMTGSEDFRVVFYKGPPFSMDHSVSEHKNYVNCLRYSPSGDVIASVGSDKKIVLYDGKEGTVAHKELKPTSKKLAHQGSIYSCAFSPDGRLLLTASADKSVKAWIIPTLDGAPECQVSSLSFGTDVGAMQNGVVWPMHATGPVSFSLAGEANYLSLQDDTLASVSKVVVAPQAPISALTVIPGDVVVVGCNDGTVFTVAADSDEWSKVRPAPTAGAPKAGASPVRPCHTGKVTALCPAPPAVAPDLAFVSCGFDDKLRLSNLEAYVTELSVDGQPNGLAALEDAVVFSTTKGIGRLAVAPTLSVAAFEATSFDPTTLSARASDVLVGAKDGTLRVLDHYTLEEKQQLPAHRGEITAIAYSPDGAAVAVGDADREIKLYAPAEAYSVKLQSLWRFHTARITALAWNPSSTYLASTSSDESIFVWSLEKPQTPPIKLDFAHKDGVTALTWFPSQSPPGLVSAGNDGSVCVWTVIH